MHPQQVALRGSLGIDCSKDALVCCLGQIDAEGQLHWSDGKEFTNTAAGFADCEQWLTDQLQVDRSSVTVVLEATGVYYESVTHFLSKQDWQVAVVAPRAARHFAASYGTKTKTDRIDARLLATMGLERSLPVWTIPDPLLAKLKHLCREYQDTVKARTAHSNKLHALEHGVAAPAASLRRQKQTIRMLNHQCLAIERDIKRLLRDSGGPLNDAIERIMTIQGVGLMTAVTVMAETDGFSIVADAKQVVSYAGLDVALHQSGKHKGRSSISKRGNARLRAALYMPALTAIRHNPQLKTFYTRLVAKKQSKKIGLIAVMRKLLALIYTIWKNGTKYNPNYELEQKTQRAR